MSAVRLHEVIEKVLKEFPDASPKEQGEIIEELTKGHDLILELGDGKVGYKPKEQDK